MRTIAIFLFLISSVLCSFQISQLDLDKINSKNPNTVTIYIAGGNQNHSFTLNLQDNHTISYLHEIVSKTVLPPLSKIAHSLQIQLPTTSFELAFNGAKLSPKSAQTIGSFGKESGQIVFLNKIGALKSHEEMRLRRVHSFDSLRSLVKSPKAQFSSPSIQSLKRAQSITNFEQLIKDPHSVRQKYRNSPLSSRRGSDNTLEEKKA